MKRILFFIGSIVCVFAFCRNVNAETYQADELVKGQKLEAGDVIEYGSGVINGQSYGHCRIPHVEENLPYTVTNDMYICHTPSIAYIEEPTGRNYFFELYGFNYYIDFPEQIRVNQGNTTTIVVNVQYATPPYTFNWNFSDVNGNLARSITTDNNSIEVEYGKYISAGCEVIDANGERAFSYCDITNISKEDPLVENIKEEKSPEEHIKTKEQIELEKKNKDTLPTGTIQGIGDKKEFNFKALNPEERNVNNQIVYADFNARKLGYKSEILISKDIYAPYGQTKDTKWKTKTIRWKNTGAKYGDIIYVVWYCQEAKEIQFIKANVLFDGTVEFIIPKSGDVSTISIVKLSK